MRGASWRRHTARTERAGESILAAPMADERTTTSRPLRLSAPNARARTHVVRVLYGDTDKAQVVHHARYLDYLEGARLEFLRAHGLDYRAFEERTGLGMPVVQAELRYRAPARFDDLLEVQTWVSHASRAKVVFEARIRRGDELLLEAAITVACVDVAAGRVVSVVEEVRRACAG